MQKVIGENPRRQTLPLFGGYRLLRALKRGPFLESHLVQTESPPHNLFVLKRLHPLVIHRADWVARFLREARRAAVLWHPNIVRVVDLGEINGIPYFIQPCLFGKKLQTLLSRSRTLPIPTGMALLIVQQIVEALDAAHRIAGAPIVHGGLHPERIFISYDGVIHVSDFGLGWLEDPRSAVRSRYRAPEAVVEKREEAHEHPAEDLYAVSAILCELLGEVPEPIKPGLSPWGYLSEPVRSILMRGLAAEPAARFQTAGEMRGALEAILQRNYLRLNLSNYIQAFFGKEIEAEGKSFDRVSSNEVVLSRPSPIQSVDAPPLMLIPPASPPRPASVEVISLPSISTLSPLSVEMPSAGTDSERTSVLPAERPRRSWQPIWWVLFGLLLAGFLGVLFFSLYYRPSLFERVSLSSSSPVPPPPAPPPIVAGKTEPIVPQIEEGSSKSSPAKEIPSAPLPPPVPPAPVMNDAAKEATPLSPKKPKQARIKPAPVSPPVSPIEKPAPPSPAAALIGPAPSRPIEVVPPKPKANEELVRELIERQRQAYQNQDWRGQKADLAEGGEMERQMAELFEGARPLEVHFEVYELKLRGEEADVSLMQTARLQKEKGISFQKTLLFWKLKRDKERWKIEKFNVVEKYPATEVK
ncbi:MAG: serine/threonine protein kinase [Nitrospirae bacterium]|nr:serine/threonine protein kinase [Candidatus Manganitrophaceae bacterium]